MDATEFETPRALLTRSYSSIFFRSFLLMNYRTPIGFLGS